MTDPTQAKPTEPDVEVTPAPTVGHVTDQTGKVLEPTTLPPAETVAERDARAAAAEE